MCSFKSPLRFEKKRNLKNKRYISGFSSHLIILFCFWTTIILLYFFMEKMFTWWGKSLTFACSTSSPPPSIWVTLWRRDYSTTVKGRALEPGCLGFIHSCCVPWGVFLNLSKSWSPPLQNRNSDITYFIELMWGLMNKYGKAPGTGSNALYELNKYYLLLWNSYITINFFRDFINISPIIGCGYGSLWKADIYISHYM